MLEQASCVAAPRHLGSMAIAVALLMSVSHGAVASGWYLRAALGYERSQDADLSDRDCASQQPAALFGCARGDDGRPIGAYGDFGDYPQLELAFGKRMLPWLRTDLSLGYRFAADYQGNANFLAVGTYEPVTADLESWSAMANAFVDVAALSGADLGRFTPYIGGGIGVAHNRLGKVTYRFPQNPYRHKISVTPSGERTNFAYRVTLGTEVALTEGLALDLAAYYMDLGEVGTDSGTMAMNNVPSGIMIDETETELRALGFSIGLLYLF